MSYTNKFLHQTLYISIFMSYCYLVMLFIMEVCICGGRSVLLLGSLSSFSLYALFMSQQEMIRNDFSLRISMTIFYTIFCLEQALITRMAARLVSISECTYCCIEKATLAWPRMSDRLRKSLPVRTQFVVKVCCRACASMHKLRLIRREGLCPSCFYP